MRQRARDQRARAGLPGQSEEAVAAGRAEAKAWGLTNATFELCDAATLDRPDAFDVITAFDTIHDQAHPARVLAAIARALRPSGTFLMVDIRAASAVEDNLDLPWAPFLYTVSTMHCMTRRRGPGLGADPATQRNDRLQHRLRPLCGAVRAGGSAAAA
ncbi:MAG: class I SAM-dependent methyltransferase, partial [Propionibacteriaceae bacterium]